MAPAHQTQYRATRLARSYCIVLPLRSRARLLLLGRRRRERRERG